MSDPARGMSFAEDRASPRHEVAYDARAYGPDARPFTATIGNISGCGMMARCDAPYQPGDRLTLVLPVIGATTAAIRWAVDGRIGCEFDQPIGPAEYYELLALMVRGTA